MTKISTMFYLVDNSNNEENLEIAGKILEAEFSDVINSLRRNPRKASKEITDRIILKCKSL